MRSLYSIFDGAERSLWLKYFFKENYMMKFLNGKRTGVIDTHCLLWRLGKQWMMTADKPIMVLPVEFILLKSIIISKIFGKKSEFYLFFYQMCYNGRYKELLLENLVNI